MRPVFPCSCNFCSIYPAFLVGRIQPSPSESSGLRPVIDDRLMRVFPPTSVTTLRQTLHRRSRSPITFTCQYYLHIRHKSALAMPDPVPQQQPTIEVPPGFTLHTENTTHILLPSDNGAFLNPVQEFNRDLSVACIRVWSEEWNRAKEAKWRTAQEKKAKKPEKRLKGVLNDRTPWAVADDYNTGYCDRFEEPRGRSQGKRGMFQIDSL